MELTQLRTALAVAEDLHFTRASERLGIAQSAVSARITALEQQLGVRIFDRSSRNIAVTPIGETFLARARSLIADADRLASDIRSMAGTVAGRLRIGIITSGDLLDLPSVIAEYREHYPEVSVLVQPQVTPMTVQNVIDGSLDVGFVSVASPTLPRTLVSRRLWSERLVAVARPDSTIAKRSSVTARDLIGLPLIDFPTGTGARTQSDRLFAAAGLPRTVLLEASGAEAIADLVRGGAGIGILASTYAGRLADLARIPIARSPQRSVHMITHATKSSPETAGFTSIVEQRLASAAWMQETP